MSTTKQEIRKDIVKKAIEIMEANRWTRGYWLRASKALRKETKIEGTGAFSAFKMGQSKILAGPNQEVTCDFCIQGAIYAAAGQCGATEADAQLVIQDLDREKGMYRSIMSINDDPSLSRSKQDMIKILEKGL